MIVDNQLNKMVTKEQANKQTECSLYLQLAPFIKKKKFYITDMVVADHLFKMLILQLLTGHRLNC